MPALMITLCMLVTVFVVGCGEQAKDTNSDNNIIGVWSDGEERITVSRSNEDERDVYIARDRLKDGMSKTTITARDLSGNLSAYAWMYRSGDGEKNYFLVENPNKPHLRSYPIGALHIIEGKKQKVLPLIGELYYGFELSPDALEEQAKQKINTHQTPIPIAQPNEGVVGKWRDNTPYVSGFIVIERVANDFFMSRNLDSGEEMRNQITLTPSISLKSYRFEDSTSIANGEYYVLDSENNLKFYDEQGLIKSLKNTL